MKEIKIVITREGKVEFAVSGTKGKSCEALTEDLEAALGDLDSREHTSEYWMDPDEEVHNRICRNE